MKPFSSGSSSRRSGSASSSIVVVVAVAIAVVVVVVVVVVVFDCLLHSLLIAKLPAYGFDTEFFRLFESSETKDKNK